MLIRGGESKPVRGGFALAPFSENLYHSGMSVFQTKPPEDVLLAFAIICTICPPCPEGTSCILRRCGKCYRVYYGNPDVPLCVFSLTEDGKHIGSIDTFYSFFPNPNEFHNIRRRKHHPLNYECNVGDERKIASLSKELFELRDGIETLPCYLIQSNGVSVFS